MQIQRLTILLLLLLTAVGCARKTGTEDSSDTTAVRDTMQKRPPHFTDPDGPPIRVDTPEPAVPVTGDSITLRGSIRKGERGIRYRLLQGRTTLAEGSIAATVDPGDTTARPRFTGVLAKPKLQAAPGGRAPSMLVLQVTLDGADTSRGAPRVMIPLSTSDTGDRFSGTFNLHFHNISLNKPEECEAVQTVKRIGPRRLDPRFVMMLLLRGPTPEEQERGYRTVIPAGTTARSASVREGTATVDLSTDVQKAADDCSRRGIRAEIEQTMRQIEGVKAVQITVMGRPY